MYKLTEIGNRTAIYDSESNPLPEGTVYFHTHQMLWKDDIFLGRIFIDSHEVRLMMNGTITFLRNKFQELFMRDAPIVELIFNANEVERVELVLNKNKAIDSTERNLRSVELDDYSASKFYGYLYYWLK